MALRMTENHTELSFRYMRIEGRKEKLLDFLLRKFRYLDREEWLENIREKRLTVDGRNADQHYDHRRSIVFHGCFRATLRGQDNEIYGVGNRGAFLYGPRCAYNGKTILYDFPSCGEPS